MSSSPWGPPSVGPPPPTSAQSQGQLYFPPGQHFSHGDSDSKSQHDSHGQAGYTNPQTNFPEQNRLPLPLYMNQEAVHTNQYQNTLSNSPSYNSQPIAPSAPMPPPNPRGGQGSNARPQLPHYFPLVPPPMSHDQFRLSDPKPSMTLPPPPFPIPPLQQQHHWKDGKDQKASNVMTFSPSLPPPPLPPPPSSHQPKNEWSSYTSPVGPVHGQWNHKGMENDYEPQTMINSTQNNVPSHPKHFLGRNKNGGSISAQARVQPYQPCRSKQSEGSRQNSFPVKPASGGGGLHFTDIEQSVKTEVGHQEINESEDQKWVNEWSKSLQRHDGVSKEARKPIVKLSEVRILLTKFLHLLDQLKRKREEASDSLMKETDERKWSHLCKEMEKQAEDLSELQSRINHPGFVEGLKSQIEKRRRKRDRGKRHRTEEWEIREEALRVRNEKIDTSMAAALQAKQEKEQEEVLQKEVDQVLSEVHRKKQDANKMMELFRALRKLRQLRKESAEKRVGYKTPRVLDERFEKKMTFLEEMMNTQKLLYVEEEKALQVMLEEEHEETREKARQKKEMKERQKAEKAWKEQLEFIFGKAEELELGHPLFMYRHFHQQASHDLQSLTNIRRQWDMFVVPESDAAGSSIPVSWVMPSDPSNHIWATAIVDSSGT